MQLVQLLGATGYNIVQIQVFQKSSLAVLSSSAQTLPSFSLNIFIGV